MLEADWTGMYETVDGLHVFDSPAQLCKRVRSQYDLPGDHRVWIAYDLQTASGLAWLAVSLLHFWSGA